MKRILMVLCLALFTAQPAKADLILNQDFDSGSWAFTESPAAYNGASGSDIWETSTSVGTGGLAITSGSSGSTFWGMRDLNNPNGGGSFDHTLTFSDTSIAGFTERVLTFDYNYVLYDTTDDLQYEVSIDGVGQGVVDINGGSSSESSSGWETVMFSIPDSASSIGLTLIANQDGGGDWAGWDNVQVNGTAVPEPSSLALVAFGVVGLAVRRRRG